MDFFKSKWNAAFGDGKKAAPDRAKKTRKDEPRIVVVSIDASDTDAVERDAAAVLACEDANELLDKGHALLGGILQQEEPTKQLDNWVGMLMQVMDDCEGSLYHRGYHTDANSECSRWRALFEAADVMNIPDPATKKTEA